MNFQPTVTEEQFPQKYQALLNAYNSIKDEIKSFGSSKNLDLEIQKFDQLIGEAQSNGSEITTQASYVSSGESEDKATALQLSIQKQKQQLQKIQQEVKAAEKRYQQILASKQAQLNALKQSLTTNQSDVQLKTKAQEIEELDKEIIAFSDQFSLHELGLDKLSNENKNKQQELSFLLDSTKDQENKINQSKNRINQLNEKVAQSSQLLTSLQNQYNQLKNASQSSQPSQQQKNKLKKLQQQLQTNDRKINQLQKQFQKVSLNDNKIKQSSKQYEQKSNNKNKQVKAKQDKLAQIRDQIEKMKKQRDQLNQQRKNRKSKPAFDAKTQIMKLEKQNQSLARQLERQAKKLKQYIEIRKTYVKNDVLVKAKEQLDQYRIKNKALEPNVKRLAKLQQTHKYYSDSINNLRKVEAQIISQKQGQMAQTKQKVKQLIESKTFYERNIAHCKNKLSEYMKEYPDHEKNKIEEKQRLKREQNQRKKAKQQEIRNNAAQKKKAKKKTEEDETDEELKILQILNADPKPKQESILNNQNIQIAGAAAILAVAAAVYAMI